MVEEGQHLAQGAKPVNLAAHRPGDALDGAEQVGQHRDIERRPVLADGVLEQHGGAVLGQQPGLDLGDLVPGRDRRRNARQRALALEEAHIIAE